MFQGKTDATQGKNIEEKNVSYEKRESQSFVVEVESFDKGKKKPRIHSLQAAFQKFRHDRQDEIRQIRLMKHRQLEEARDPVKMQILREKFVEQAKKYFGVPYAKKYWKPEDPQYHSPIFLDCCGLVRQVLRDLAEEFGFQIASWNQAYMFDTLPLKLTEDQMKPGDLVFISATYYNTKSKKQRHDMVHVEIWLGDGPKTIGARWQKGHVQIFPHYAFEAKSYHSETYHFRSIDTWLMGICQSFCTEHPWRRSAYDPSRLSIFSPDDNEEEESAGDTDIELVEEDSINSKQKKSERKKHKSQKVTTKNPDSNRNKIKDNGEGNVLHVTKGKYQGLCQSNMESNFSLRSGIVCGDDLTKESLPYCPTNGAEQTLENMSLPCALDCLCMSSDLSIESSDNLDPRNSSYSCPCGEGTIGFSLKDTDTPGDFEFADNNCERLTTDENVTTETKTECLREENEDEGLDTGDKNM